MIPRFDLDGIQVENMGAGCWQLWSPPQMAPYTSMWHGWWWPDGHMIGGQYGTEPIIHRQVSNRVAM